MLSETLLNLLNEQIATEYFAANQYLAMSTFMLNKNLCGFAKFLRKSAEEEREHGDGIYDYILEHMNDVNIGEIKAPENSWENCVLLFENVLALEKKVTALIHNMLKIASAEGDFVTIEFLNDYAKEQVKSENEITYIIETLQMIGSDIGALRAFDCEIGCDLNA
jgi:ferritin